MIKSDIWPPPEGWTEIIIMWEEVIYEPQYPIRDILEWLDSAPGGEYHIHGYESTEGFCFRFCDPVDATHFKLRWL